MLFLDGTAYILCSGFMVYGQSNPLPFMCGWVEWMYPVPAYCTRTALLIEPIGPVWYGLCHGEWASRCVRGQLYDDLFQFTCPARLIHPVLPPRGFDIHGVHAYAVPR